MTNLHYGEPITTSKHEPMTQRSLSKLNKYIVQPSSRVQSTFVDFFLQIQSAKAMT